MGKARKNGGVFMALRHVALIVDETAAGIKPEGMHILPTGKGAPNKK